MQKPRLRPVLSAFDARRSGFLHTTKNRDEKHFPRAFASVSCYLRDFESRGRLTAPSVLLGSFPEFCQCAALLPESLLHSLAGNAFCSFGADIVDLSRAPHSDDM